MKNLYTAHATSVAGRSGYVETDDQSLSFKLSAPGSGEQGTNPEQLFACGYGACFGGAVSAVAKKRGIETGEVKIQSEVSLNQDDEGGFFLAVTLNATFSGLERDKAVELVRAAHEVCPYSKATRGNITVELKVSGQKID